MYCLRQKYCHISLLQILYNFFLRKTVHDMYKIYEHPTVF